MKKKIKNDIEYPLKVENAESEKLAKEILEVLKELQEQGKSINREEELDEFGRRLFPSLKKQDQRDKRYKEVELDYQKMQKFYELPIPKKNNQLNEKQEDSGWGGKIYNFLSSFFPAAAAATGAAIKAVFPEGDYESALRKGEKPWIASDDIWNNDLKTLEMHDMEDDIEEIKNQIPKAIAVYEKQLTMYQEGISDKLGERIQTMPEMIKDAIDDNIATDKNWEFSDEANELYALYFKNKKEQYEGNAEEIQKIQEEEAERQRKLLEHSTQIQKETQEQSQASRLEAEKQKNKKEQELLQEEIANRTEASNKMGSIEAQKSDEILEAKTSATLELIGIDDMLVQNNKKIEQSEADSHKKRAEQWQEYAEKVSAISQQISEVTGMVTSSLGGMFSELSASYAQEIESLNEKITAVDEEKNAALERVTLTEDERRAREEELAEQKISLETATSDEQKSKADERIATLQGELGAEDSINREFEGKKASLEKEKEKKEKAQKKAEKMQKRLEMGQRIVESIGNVAAGVAKALSHGPILGPILAAIVSTAGAIQVGVMTKQLAKMEDGGLLKGKRHAQGGMRILGSNIEVEGGEYVINRQSTDKNLGLLSYINRQRRELDSNDMHNFFSAPLPNFQPPAFANMFEKGGQVPMLPMSESTDVERLLAGMQNLKIDSHVSVTDINTVQQNMTRVDEWTGI